MGHYSYSRIDPSRTKDDVRAVLSALVGELWPDGMRLEEVKGVPVSREDDREAKWCFHPADPGWGDAAFSISLARRGGSLKLEFKTPVSEEGRAWQRQIRHKAAARLRE